MTDREELRRGDDYEWVLVLKDPKGTALDLRGVTIVATAKPVGSDLSTDLDALYRHTAVIDGTGTLTAPVGFRLGGTLPHPPYTVYTTALEGVVTEFLTDLDVLALAAAYDAGRGQDPREVAVWDVQVTDANGITKTVLSGTYRMRRDVGRLTVV